MFASNKKVSVRQLNRIIITENIGMVSLFAGHLAGMTGNVTYVWLLVSAMFISMGYMWISLKISCRFGEKLIRSRIYNILSAARFFFMGIAGIYVFYKTVSQLLLINTASIVIISAIGLLCVFMGKCDYEARGRMHEILGIVVMIPIIIILATSVFKVDFAYGERQLMEGFRLPDRDTFIMVCIMFHMVTYFEKLIVIRNHYHNTYGNRISLLKAPIVLWVTAICVFIICTCIFGENATLLKLMDIGGIPGGFLNRQESIMAVFLVISLTSYVSGMFYYIRQNVKNLFIRYVKKPHIVTRRIVSAVLIIMMIGGAFVLASGTEEKTGRFIGGREIEEWDFVMAMIVAGEDDGISVTLEIAGYGDSESKYVTYSRENMRDKEADRYGQLVEGIEKAHVEGGGNTLDFSHIKGIIYSNLSEKEKKSFTYMLEGDKRFSGNVMVYYMEPEENPEPESEYVLGKTLEKLGKNVDKYKDSCLYKAGISIKYIKSIDEKILYNKDASTETDHLEK